MADDTSREYQAIDPKDKTRRASVELRFRDGRRYWLKHVDRHLMALSPDQKSLALSFYSMSAVILGRNLLEVATAIDGRNTPYLQEYDPLRWDIPTDPKAVFIEKMELYQPRQEGDQAERMSMPELEKAPEGAKH